VKVLLGPDEESAAAAAVVLGAIGPVASSRLALRKVIRDAKKSHGLRMAAVPAILRATPAQQIVGRIFVEGFVDDGLEGNGTDEGRVSDRVEIPLWNDETSAASYGPMLAAILIATGRSTIEIPSLLEVTPAAFPRRLRLTAITALAVLEGDARRGLPALRKLLNDDDALLRNFSGLAILRIAGDAAEIPSIMKAMSLGEPDGANFLRNANEFFEQKEQTSQRLRKDAAEIVPFGIKTLNHRNPFHKRQAIHMLGEIGPLAREALPALKELLADQDSDTSAAVKESIRKIEMTASSASNRGEKEQAE
jgi:HEAT repeat protein